MVKSIDALAHTSSLNCAEQQSSKINCFNCSFMLCRPTVYISCIYKMHFLLITVKFFSRGAIILELYLSEAVCLSVCPSVSHTLEVKPNNHAVMRSHHRVVHGLCS